MKHKPVKQNMNKICVCVVVVFFLFFLQRIVIPAICEAQRNMQKNNIALRLRHGWMFWW
jgi:hypothetical protein